MMLLRNMLLLPALLLSVAGAAAPADRPAPLPTPAGVKLASAADVIPAAPRAESGTPTAPAGRAPGQLPERGTLTLAAFAAVVMFMVRRRPGSHR